MQASAVFNSGSLVGTTQVLTDHWSPEIRIWMTILCSENKKLILCHLVFPRWVQITRSNILVGETEGQRHHGGDAQWSNPHLGTKTHKENKQFHKQ